MHDEPEHRITLAWARTAPRLNSLGRAVAFRAIPMASFSCQAHIRRACDAGVRVLVYGRRRQERRAQGAPSGGVSWPRSGRGTTVVDSRGAVRRDAHKSRAWRPWQFAGKRGCLREGRIYQPANTKAARAIAWLRWPLVSATRHDGGSSERPLAYQNPLWTTKHMPPRRPFREPHSPVSRRRMTPNAANGNSRLSEPACLASSWPTRKAVRPSAGRVGHQRRTQAILSPDVVMVVTLRVTIFASRVRVRTTYVSEKLSWHTVVEPRAETTG